MARILMIVLFGLLIQTIGSIPLEDLKQNNKSPRQTITVYTEKNASPFAAVDDNGVLYGFAIDILNFIALNVNINYVFKYTTFDQLIPSVQADSNAIAMSAVTITVDRQKMAVFAQYFRSGSTFLVLSTSNLKITVLSDLCGLKVVVQTGSTQEKDIKNLNCTKPITISSFPNYPDLVAKVKDGSADVAVDDQALLSTAANLPNSGVKLVGKIYNVAPYGIVCNTGNEELCSRLVASINSYIDDGGYNYLLHRYSFNYSDNGVCPSRLNLDGSVYGTKPKNCAKRLA